MTFPALRYVTQAGGGMAPARVLEWLDRGPRVPFFVMYGASEASARLTYLPPADLRRKLGSVGRPIPNVEIVVATENDAVAAPGQIGELIARGMNVSSGYWNNPEETAAKFTSRGYRTGDLGYADEEGYLYIVSRKGDMIKIGAHRVGPKEIEDALQEHSGVLEAAVIGVPDDTLGEAPVAFVVARPSATLDGSTLQAFCRGRLAPYKIPLRVTFIPELPKLPSGKIDRRALSVMQTHMRKQFS
jgi:long-chain acyl-CoA synthetase